jgi:hypothetical protein
MFSGISEAAAAKANVGNIPTIIKTASKADTILGNRFFIVYQILSVLGIKITPSSSPGVTEKDILF